jgi:hypothetical protein
MSETFVDKPAGTLVRVCRGNADTRRMECGWAIVRTEPDSGNVVCERNGERIICARQDFEKANFADSDAVWDTISKSQNDDDLKDALSKWTELDLRGLSLALLRYARRLDPSFAGVQTVTDLFKKISESEEACKRSMDLLRIETSRARAEYQRFPARTAMEYDKKDSLLSRVRELEDKYAAREYRFKELLPAWRRLASALKNIDAKFKNA